MSAAAALNTRIRRRSKCAGGSTGSGVRRYLRQSIAFWGIPGAGLADEETPLVSDAPPPLPPMFIVTEIERRLHETTVEGIALRYGFFYGPGTGSILMAM